MACCSSSDFLQLLNVKRAPFLLVALFATVNITDDCVQGSQIYPRPKVSTFSSVAVLVEETPDLAHEPIDHMS